VNCRGWRAAIAVCLRDSSIPEVVFGIKGKCRVYLPDPSTLSLILIFNMQAAHASCEVEHGHRMSPSLFRRGATPSKIIRY
jgi:hypothetical protein